jgi:pimeloyl-ACP methyl ester carboxylesterase
MMRALRPHLLSLVILGFALAAAGCQRTSQPNTLDRLHPCATEEGPGDAYCGTLSVFENRQTRTGRQIKLTIVVLPAVSSDEKPDPLFFLAGGPGQAAAQMAPAIKQTFGRIQRTRDIVLVDQRGTGKSHPLDCRDDGVTLREALEPPDASMPRLRKCLAGYDADVRLYTTPIAMDDLDDVRAYLGYDRINVYGGSYGTRAALVYMRQHGEHVRATVLDSVAPMDMRLPLFAARDAERAFDALLTDCEADERCHAMFPGLRDRVRTLLTRLDAHPVRTRLVHPRTGVAEDVDVDARFVSTVMLGALYSPSTASILPVLLDRAERNDFQGLLALGLSGAGDDAVSVGMQLSVLCSEDYPRLTPHDIAEATSNTIFGDRLFVGQIKACEFWPRGQIGPSYYAPVVSSIPTLVLSGGVDPVTPPSWGQSVADHLNHSLHVVVPESGHGVIGTACGWQLIQTFIDHGSVDGLDTSCAKQTQRPPFFLSPSGPDPAFTHHSAAQ